MICCPITNPHSHAPRATRHAPRATRIIFSLFVCIIPKSANGHTMSASGECPPSGVCVPRGHRAIASW
jgi:hypothetical protein